jgi:hypothetical protein
MAHMRHNRFETGKALLFQNGKKPLDKSFGTAQIAGPSLRTLCAQNPGSPVHRGDNRGGRRKGGDDLLREKPMIRGEGRNPKSFNCKTYLERTL